MFIFSAMSSVTHVDYEFAGAADVAGRVFGNKRLPRPIGYAHAADGRIGAQVVVGAEGRRVQPPILIHAGDQRDRPRRHQATATFRRGSQTTFQIETNRMEHSLRFDGNRFTRQGRFSQFSWDSYLSARKLLRRRLRKTTLRLRAESHKQQAIGSGEMNETGEIKTA
jgi:hypothetical protein